MAVVCAPVEEINAQADSLLASLAAITTAAMLLAGAAIVLFARRTAAPLVHLSEACRIINGGNSRGRTSPWSPAMRSDSSRRDSTR